MNRSGELLGGGHVEVLGEWCPPRGHGSPTALPTHFARHIADPCMIICVLYHTLS